ncbi:MAG: hypothetical protein M0017_06500 [Desulfobacteraceae bacterium]|nr:hypothetical protein [Desulfobacteraceae bacterium]
MASVRPCPETLNHLLDQAADRFPDRPAVDMALKQPLTDRTLREKDRGAILAENSPNRCIACPAMARLGALVGRSCRIFRKRRR